MGSLEGDDLAQSPQDGAGDLSQALPLQNLRSAGYEPKAVGGKGVSVGNALHQGQRAGAGVAHVRSYFLGGCLWTVAIERLKVYDAAEGDVPRQTLDQRLPLVTTFGVERGPENGGADYRRFVRVRRFGVRQNHHLIARGQLRREFLRQAGVVGCKHPDARRLCHLRRPPGHDDALVQGLGRVRFVNPEDFDRFKTRVAERLAPDRGASQGVVRAVVVGESPPAVQLAEGQVHPADAAEILECDQLAGGGKQISTVPQRFLQVAGGV